MASPEAELEQGFTEALTSRVATAARGPPLAAACDLTAGRDEWWARDCHGCCVLFCRHCRSSPGVVPGTQPGPGLAAGREPSAVHALQFS